ncbi:MAG TPA: amino acid racemase [Burkholderiaceae bacterium]|nr:amino acid racemase [Burkholderiaceae bacterium]
MNNNPRNTHERGGIVGVLGGMGPLATIDFMHKVLAATPAERDQDHVPLVVASIPQVPDRSAAFRGDGESPLAAMIASGRRLRDAGAGLVVMPCNTAHLWFDALRAALDLPMLHLVDAALDDAIAQVGADARLGLLCTEATLASRLYLDRAPRIDWVVPSATEMREWVMPGIAAIKAGALDRGRELLHAAAHALVQRGAQALVLGCTEVPLVLVPGDTPAPVIDATAALARRAVRWSAVQRDGAPAPALNPG